jgi:hypothetical protein
VEKFECGVTIQALAIHLSSFNARSMSVPRLPLFTEEEVWSAQGFPDNPHTSVQKSDKSVTSRSSNLFILSLKATRIFERDL